MPPVNRGGLICPVSGVATRGNSTDTQTDPPPNVLVFFIDQQRWDTTGVHGNPMSLTPNFDPMAVEGTHCFNAFTCQPVRVPACMALQTGRYPARR